MTRENPDFNDGKYYHIVNFGIEDKLVFNDKKDIDRFVSLLEFYRFKNPPSRFAFRNRPTSRTVKKESDPMVEVLAYSLMPTHFHLLLEQTDGGISQYLSKISNSYTKYYNARQKRRGPLFVGTFKASEIEADKLSFISRHIHLEPVLSEIVEDPSRYPFSSYSEYISESKGFCQKQQVLNGFDDSQAYKKFVEDQDDYKSSLPQIKDLILE